MHVVVVLTDTPGEDTPTGAKLGQVIDHYLPLIEHERSTHEPVTILVITDGLPSKLWFHMHPVLAQPCVQPTKWTSRGLLLMRRIVLTVTTSSRTCSGSSSCKSAQTQLLQNSCTHWITTS